MSKESRDPEDRWRALLETARQLIDAHDTIEARAVLHEAVEYTE